MSDIKYIPRLQSEYKENCINNPILQMEFPKEDNHACWDYGIGHWYPNFEYWFDSHWIDRLIEKKFYPEPE